MKKWLASKLYTWSWRLTRWARRVEYGKPSKLYFKRDGDGEWKELGTTYNFTIENYNTDNLKAFMGVPEEGEA